MYSNTYLTTSIRNYLILMMFQFTELRRKHLKFGWIRRNGIFPWKTRGIMIPTLGMLPLESIFLCKHVKVK